MEQDLKYVDQLSTIVEQHLKYVENFANIV